MKRTTFVVLLGLLLLCIWMQAPGSAALAAENDTQALNLTDAQKEQFLLTAEVIKRKENSVGVTHTYRLTLSDGKLTHDAHMQCIDDSKATYQTPSGTEVNFRDCYKFNVAAYHLDRMIQLNMVPVSVERSVGKKACAVTWWHDDVQMMERDRYKKKIEPPDPLAWNYQIYQARIFHELVYNVDANLTNFLITSDWKLVLVDFSRAFRRHKSLRHEPNLVRIHRRVYDGLKNLETAEVERRLGRYLMKYEIEGVMARRDKIIEVFDRLIAQKGEQAVFCDSPNPPTE